MIDDDRSSVLSRLHVYLMVILLLLGQFVTALPANAMTLAEERLIGEKLLYSVRKHFRLLDDPDISQYMNGLGQEVLEAAGPRLFQYHFFVVASDQFNAFAAPAGLVFSYTGLLETMQSEDELVSVMAHEIGHVTSRHIAGRLEKSTRISAITMALGLASLALGVPQLSQGLLAGSIAAGQTLNLHYSRQDEEQADRISFELMQKMHRNPRAMVRMLQVMRRITRYRSDKLPQYLLTHPDPDTRLGYVQSLLELDPHQHEKGFYRKTDEFSFQRIRYRILFQTRDAGQIRTVAMRQKARADHDVLLRSMSTYGLALAAAQEHAFGKALKLLKQVRQALPERNILRVDEAVLLLELGKFQESERVLQRAIHRDPTDIYAQFILGKALSAQGKTDQAERLYMTVSTAMPEYAAVFFELGKIMADTGRQAASHFYLGKYYLYEGKVRLARHYLRKVAASASVKDALREEAQSILDRLKKLEKL